MALFRKQNNPVLSKIINDRERIKTKDCKTTKREAIEWINIRWHDEAETARLPRVLLIGDSIVAGHATLLRDKLKGRFGIDYFATSKIVSDHEFMPDLLFMLGRYKYDMIIFNNGLHGSAIDDGAYGKALFATLSVLKQYAPQLVWRNSTPCYPSSDKKTNPWITRVQKRNRIASKEVAKLDILTIDCYKVLAGKPELSSDGAHFTPKGYSIMVDTEADFIEKYFAKVGMTNKKSLTRR